MGVAWEIELTDEAQVWIESLSDSEFAAMAAAIDRLELHGPSLGRPTVDTISGSRHHNMKELRSHGGNLRMLFAFDPRRTAIVLLGGDKTGDWKGWYDRNIPRADALYDEHLADLREHDPPSR